MKIMKTNRKNIWYCHVFGSSHYTLETVLRILCKSLEQNKRRFHNFCPYTHFVNWFLYTNERECIRNSITYTKTNLDKESEINWKIVLFKLLYVSDVHFILLPSKKNCR